ncbi:MAG TPA: hypothetical protein VHM67_10055 [Gemmatimonadaceae bacterium]|nr:hypothetical protein [Gemmatimonadaceae bacterium]
MPIVPLYGHEPLRARLLEAARDGRLPSSLLLHGPAGVGKQRLALWLATALLCDRPDQSPCGRCESCRFSAELAHPDLHWIFPRPRLKGADARIEDVRDDLAEAIAERVAAGGLYPRPSGSEGLYVVTVRAIVHRAGLSPAMARRKVFVAGDVERMVPQEGSEQAANAFLKLLEEPPADTTLILTSSEPGALLPTIRSRVVAVHVPRLADDDVRAFLADPLVEEALEKEDLGDRDELAEAARGAPGLLIGGSGMGAAREQAKRLLEAAESGDRTRQLRVAFAQGATRARGHFSDTLDALTELVHERARSRAVRGDAMGAVRAARAIDAIECAREMAFRNVSPNLITASLLGEMARD